MSTTASKSESDSNAKSLLLRGAMRFMQPVTRLMLRMGVTYAEFAELCKTVFVHVAASDYGIRGRRANNSRIAILTGLGRKQVSHQVTLLESEQVAEPAQMSPATRLITAWSKDPDFVASDGSPRELPASGEGVTFSALSARYAGDLPHGALLKELLRVGAVEEQEDGRLKLVNRSFLATGLDPDHIRILATQLEDLGGTIVHNLDPPKGGVRRLQRFVVNDKLPRRYVREFQELATRESQALLERLDSWLAERELTEDSPERDKAVRTGVGIYFFEDAAGNPRGDQT